MSTYRLSQTVAPYATLARFYDAVLGDRFFMRLQRVFEGLVQRYGIRFVSAADVACGTGTFTRYLCERGVPVVYGVDRSPEMLRIAIMKNRSNGARFLRKGFTNLQLPQSVDLLTCCFDALNYLLTADHLLRALRRFRANTNPGGHLIFDMFSDRPSRRKQEPRIERVTTPSVSVERVTRWDSRCDLQTAHVSIARNGHSYRELHVQRGYPFPLVVGLLAQARFALLGVHDFETFGPATTWTQRAVYVAQAVPLEGESWCAISPRYPPVTRHICRCGNHPVNT